MFVIYDDFSAILFPQDFAKGLVLLTQFSSLFTGGANWSILWMVTASTFPTRMRWVFFF